MRHEVAIAGCLEAASFHQEYLPEQHVPRALDAFFLEPSLTLRRVVSALPCLDLSFCRCSHVTLKGLYSSDVGCLLGH